MRTACLRVRRFLATDDGPTAVEYAVMLMLIILVCIGAVMVVGQNTSGNFSKSSNSINSAINSVQ